MKRKIKISGRNLTELIRRSVKELFYAGEGEDTLNPQPLNEALHSYPTDAVKRHLAGKFRLAPDITTYYKNPRAYNGIIQKRKCRNKCDVLLLAIPKGKVQLLKDITLSMEISCGWFLARRIRISDRKMEAWQFEKKMDNDATAETFRQQFIYHLAPTSCVVKIMHIGLIPRMTTWLPYKLDEKHTFYDYRKTHYGWRTVERVYAFLDIPSDEFLGNNSFGEKQVATDTYTLLRIDVSNLNPNAKFYLDPRCDRAVYSLNTIPPYAIERL